jgi:hypothetical protein
MSFALVSLQSKSARPWGATEEPPSAAEEPVDAAVRSADLHQYPHERPSFRKRASRSLARFLIAFCIGVAATLAWQSYGDGARDIVARSTPPLAWLAPQAGTAASPAPSPDLEQIKAMSLGLAVVRQSLGQLAALVAQSVADQEQMARDITQLQGTEQDILDKISSTLPSRPAAAPARKPVPLTPAPLTPPPAPTARLR